MVVYENILIVCGESLYLIDINSKKILKNLNVLYQIQTIIEINDDYFITGDVIGGLKEWKIDCQNKKVKLVSDKENAHEKCIESLIVLNNDVIVSASDDNKIKVWNL
jgi:WD40 repeat protein